MSWIDTIWSLNAATCLVLGFTYLLIWLQRREKVVTGIFAILAFATFTYAIIELWLLRTSDPVQFGSLVQWAQIPFFFTLVAIVAMVRIYLRAGRIWLAWVIVVGRVAALVLNFIFSPNVNYREISAMRHIPFLGETVFVPVGVPNMWRLVGHISILLLVVFVADAALTVWRRRDPLRVRLLSLAIFGFAFSMMLMTIMFFWVDPQIPLTPSLFFLGIVLVMGFELSMDILRAAELAGERQKLVYDLGERVKELTALHDVALILRDERKSVTEMLQEIVEVLPTAWQYTEVAAARIQYRDVEVTTANFVETQWSQSADFTAAECRGVLEVVYLEERPGAHIGPFMLEEEKLINSLAEIVGVALHRRYADIELRTSEEKYRDLFENALDMIFTHDLEGKFLSINRACEQTLGYTLDEARNMNFIQIIAPEDIEKAMGIMEQNLAGEKTTVHDLQVVTKDGRSLAVEVTSRTLSQDGIPIGIQGIARDVTERRHLEESLRQSQKLEGIGQLAGGIAHDFNNLLTAINGYADLSIRKIKADDPVRQNIEEIRKAGDRAAALTGQLLAFSRRQVLSPHVHNVNTVIQDIEKMLGRLIKASVELNAVYDPDLGNVKADAGQIEQVIINLALNARDAMPDGGTLTIETQNIHLDQGFDDPHLPSDPGEYVRITITDTGVGMDAAVKERIFEPFFTTKEVGKGTGLGLATVYGIITQSGGNIKVYSEVGHGTSFKIYLPRVDEAEQQVVWHEEGTDDLTGVETILLVEDDEAVRSLVLEILKGQGYHVLEADNGKAALAICETYLKPIHLLLTDVIMPGISGRALKDQIVSLLPDIKVIFMSGYTDDSISNKGLLESDAPFIEKPFTPLQISRKIRDVLDS